VPNIGTKASWHGKEPRVSESMGGQLRELLTRIPASPETDELQDLLTVMETDRLKKNAAMRDGLIEAKAGLEFCISLIAAKVPDYFDSEHSTPRKALQCVNRALNKSLG